MMSFFSLSVGWSLQTAEIKLKNDFIPTGSEEKFAFLLYITLMCMIPTPQLLTRQIHPALFSFRLAVDANSFSYLSM